MHETVLKNHLELHHPQKSFHHPHHLHHLDCGTGN